MLSALRHIPSIFVKRRPIHLTFFVTRKCNARCPWCFYLNSRDPVPEAEPLTLAEISRVSDSLGRLLWVAFSGGEAFLRDDLAEIAGTFHDRNRPRFLLFPTNGLLPQAIEARTEAILRRCPDSLVIVKLSLDGIGDRHDALRRSPGAFAKAMETYRALGRLRARYRNLELGINTVFLSENEDAMDEVIDYVAALETAGTHTVSAVRGNLVEERYKRIDATKYRRAAERLARDLKAGVARIHGFSGARLKAAQDILQRRLIHRTLVEDRRLLPCYAGALSLVLTESGEVHPCETLGESLGNVRAFDCDIGRLLRSEPARRGLQPIREGACHCTHECNFVMNILFNPALYPALVREYLGLGAARHGPAAVPDDGAGTASCRPTARTGSAGR